MVDHGVLGRETSYHKYTKLESAGSIPFEKPLISIKTGTAHGGLEEAKPLE